MRPRVREPKREISDDERIGGGGLSGAPGVMEEPVCRVSAPYQPARAREKQRERESTREALADVQTHQPSRGLYSQTHTLYTFAVRLYREGCAHSHAAGAKAAAAERASARIKWR